MNKLTDFAVSLTAFLSDYLPYQLGASPNTILSYRDTFKLFLIFCRQEKGLKPEKLLIKHCQKRLLEEFLAWLEAARNCAVATRNQRLAALHAFFRYLQTEKPEYLLQFQEILALRAKKAPKATIN